MIPTIFGASNPDTRITSKLRFLDYRLKSGGSYCKNFISKRRQGENYYIYHQSKPTRLEVKRLRNSFTIAKYKLLNAFNMMLGSKGTIIASIIFFVFMCGMLIFVSFFMLDRIETVFDYLPIILGIFFILPIFNGFRGRGMRASPEDQDFILTTPVNPREYFMAIQITAISSILIFLLPVILICVLLVLHSLQLSLLGFIPIILCIVFFICLMNLVAAGVRMVVERKRLLLFVMPIVLLLAFVFYSLPILYNILPNVLAANVIKYSFSPHQNPTDAYIPLLGMFIWYIALLSIFFLGLRSHYDVMIKPIEDRTREPILEISMTGGVREILIRRELLSIIRTRTMLSPLMYIFIFLLIPLFNWMGRKGYMFASSRGGFEYVIFATIMFMVMGVSGMVQKRFSKERGTIWIQKSLPLKTEHVVDSISYAVTIVGMVYAIVILIILSIFYGSQTFAYIPLIIATGAIGANFSVYSNIASPVSEDMMIPPNMPFMMFLSFLLITPCYIPVLYMPMLASYFGMDRVSTSLILLTSLLVLIYAIPATFFLRRAAAKKLDEYEATV
ncbi:MAG: hypothetical protein MOIL_00354 [Candidatus Methanolliviera sp. GoM_oil]|nr:MAG: hypothetical protein MOIL_00354 [Candidatus Methanolliviera sp. GoM_oil]